MKPVLKAVGIPIQIKTHRVMKTTVEQLVESNGQKTQREQRQAFYAKYDPFDISMSFVDAMNHYSTFAKTMQLFARMLRTLKKRDRDTLIEVLLDTADWHKTNASEYHEEASEALEGLRKKRDTELGF